MCLHTHTHTHTPVGLIQSFNIFLLNPFTAPACKISGLKCAHIHTGNSIVDSPITFNTVHLDPCEGGKTLNDDFKFDTFIGGHFPSEMAVKGLKLALQ